MDGGLVADLNSLISRWRKWKRGRSQQQGGRGSQELAFPPRKQAVALPPAVVPEACLYKGKPIKDV